MQIFAKKIDWLSATKEDRKALYGVCRAIAQVEGIHVEVLLDQAFGKRQRYGVDYISNFRQGKIARSKAKLVYVWVLEHHLETAHSIAPDLFPDDYIDAFGEFLSSKAIRGQLRIIHGKLRDTSIRRLVRRASELPAFDLSLKLGEKFCFVLESDVDGVAVALQGYKGKWHPIVLGRAGNELATDIFERMQLLPMDNKFQPIALVETEDAGFHDFVIVVFPRQYICSFTHEEILEIPFRPILAATYHLVTVKFS